MKLDNNKVALSLGALLGLWHAMWSLLVAAGLAQSILDVIFYLHFLDNPYHVKPFNVITALLLVLVTSIIGYVFGWVFAWLWNYVHNK